MKTLFTLLAIPAMLITFVHASNGEDKLQELSNKYLLDYLKMKSSDKVTRVTKDLGAIKRQLGEEAFSRKYRIWGKYNSDDDVWIYHYKNRLDDGKPKIGNGSGMAKVLVSIKTKKIIGVWMMPK